jgi:hypothetical protein
MEFLQVTDDALAQLTAKPDLSELDLSLWHADVRAVISESELLLALTDLVRDLKRFIGQEDVSQYSEMQWSGFMSRAWNAFATAAMQSGRGTDPNVAGTSNGRVPYHSRRFALCSCTRLINQMSLRDDDSTLVTCDFGASASSTSEMSTLLAKNPLRLGKVKIGVELTSLLCESVRYQAQAEMQEVRATNARNGGAYKDIQQAFTLETMSNMACAWELMIPCQDGDVLAALYPGNDRGGEPPAENGVNQVKRGKLVPVTLVALDKWPESDQQLMSMYLGLLHLHLRLSMRYLDGNPCRSRGFKVPSTLVENLDYFVDDKATNVLHYHVDRRVEGLSVRQKTAIVAIDRAVGADNWSGFVVKTFDYYYRADSWTLPQGKVLTMVPHEQRRRAPDAALGRLLVDQFGLAVVERGGDNCAIFITPWFEGKHVPKSWRQIVRVLELLLSAHSLGYAHGDMLSQNIVFATTSDSAWIIDWDMARSVHDSPAPVYVKSYNDTIGGRHPSAKADQVIKRRHDCYSLGDMVQCWFEGDRELDSFVQALQDATYLTEQLLATAQELDGRVHLKLKGSR